MTVTEVAMTVAGALLSSHSAYYLPKTYTKLKTYFRIVQTVRNGLHMDSTSIDDVFNAAKAARTQAQTDMDAKIAADAKSDASVAAYKDAVSKFYVAAAAAFADVKPTSSP